MVVESIEKLGFIIRFIFDALFKTKNVLFSKNRLIRRTFTEQLFSIGVKSLPLVGIVSFFVGMVLMVQLVPEFKQFGAESLAGGAIGVAICRELGPTLTGIIIAGRIGSSIAAEIGSMKVTEQVDALDVMAIDPITYLVSPRLLAAMIMLPLLTILSDFLGIIGAYIIGVHVMGVVEGSFWQTLGMFVTSGDIFIGLVKTVVFGAIIAYVACYKGLFVKGGSEGIGRNTTAAVVLSIMLILFSDFIITALFV
ncbi:MAG: ABC transporter permease [Fusobacteria bacterium]|nr:ABC transporter permease [Fusobacteriota bacterium]